jgi:putative nucleotidyltransferase with HDIG domain
MAIPEMLLEGIQQLRPLPITVQRLNAALACEDVSPKKIADIVEYDGAVAANILRAANSAAYGARFRIERIRDAVVRLGTATLLDILLGEHLKSMKAPAPMFDLTEDDLWLHGAAASLAVKAIMHEASAKTIPAAATIAALVHDIGKLIMVRFLKADLSTILARCDEKNFTFVEAERELFGCDHAEIGAAVARKWSFPDPVMRAIERHHIVPLTDPEPILDAVMLANLAAKSIGVGLGGAGLNLKIDYAGSRERLGLTVEGFERACAQTMIWVAELRASEGIEESRPLSAGAV